jgi:hypothetical protein
MGESRELAGSYEVTLAPAAIRVISGLRDPKDRWELADALRTELVDGPNADKGLQFDSEGAAQDYVFPGLPHGHVYTAIPLSFDGYTAVHRPMTPGELEQLGRQHDRPVAASGFHVFDILPAGSAFGRPRLV